MPVPQAFLSALVSMPGHILAIADTLRHELNPKCDPKEVRKKYDASELDKLEDTLVGLPQMVRSLRNTLQPINTLPPEILAHVFSMLIEPFSTSFPPTPASYPVPHPLLHATHVCRQWRIAALMFPTLWATLDAAQPHFIKTVLARSGAVPLKALLRDRTCEARIDPVLADTRLLFDFAAQSANIQELHVQPKFTYGIELLALFDKSMPLLHTLTIEGIDSSVGALHQLPRLFAASYPKLRRLTLGTFTAWPDNDFANLTHLCLHHQAQNTRPRLDVFLDFLASLQCLEQLVLVDAGPTGDPQLPIPPRTVSLITLRTLDIGRWPAVRNIAHFLSRLVLPSTTTITIWGQPILRKGVDTVDVLLSDALLKCQLGPFRGLTTVSIWGEDLFAGLHDDTATGACESTQKDGMQMLSVANGGLHLVGAFNATELLPVLCKIDTQALQTLNVILEDTQPVSPETWRDVLLHVPKLTSLLILSKSSNALLSLLSSTPQNLTLSPMLCPELTTLTVADDRKCSAILLMLLASQRATRGRPLAKICVMEGEDNPYSAPLDRYAEKWLRERVATVLYKKTLDEIEQEIFAHGLRPGLWPSDAYEWAEGRIL